jgi:hypothetical protein
MLHHRGPGRISGTTLTFADGSAPEIRELLQWSMRGETGFGNPVTTPASTVVEALQARGLIFAAQAVRVHLPFADKPVLTMDGMDIPAYPLESTICTAAARLVRQAGQARTARTKARIASVVPAVGRPTSPCLESPRAGS